jgi:cell division protein FtsA
LIEEEMELGSIVIDMGGGITSFAIFHRGAMIYADSIPLGGDHVTNDIVQGVNTTRQDAERLKVLYGSAIAASSDDAEMLDIPQIDENGAIVTHHVPRSMLIGIIQPRLEEILEMVRDKLNDSGVLEHSGRRIVLTGGAALMPGMRELVQSVIGYQARLGRPIRVKGLPDSVSGAAFASTAGLLHYSCDRHAEMPHEIAAEAEKLPFFDRLRLWFHQNW